MKGYMRKFDRPKILFSWTIWPTFIFIHNIWCLHNIIGCFNCYSNFVLHEAYECMPWNVVLPHFVLACDLLVTSKYCGRGECKCRSKAWFSYYGGWKYVFLWRDMSSWMEIALSKPARQQKLYRWLSFTHYFITVTLHLFTKFCFFP